MVVWRLAGSGTVPGPRTALSSDLTAAIARVRVYGEAVSTTLPPPSPAEADHLVRTFVRVDTLRCSVKIDRILRCAYVSIVGKTVENSNQSES
jgi:hypothetical protein